MSENDENTFPDKTQLKLIIMGFTALGALFLIYPPIWFQELFYNFIQPLTTDDFLEYVILYFGILPMLSLVLYYFSFKLFLTNEVKENNLDLFSFAVKLYIVLIIAFLFWIFEALEGFGRMTH